jgi:hypothetical protein
LYKYNIRAYINTKHPSFDVFKVFSDIQKDEEEKKKNNKDVQSSGKSSSSSIMTLSFLGNESMKIEIIKRLVWFIILLLK